MDDLISRQAAIEAIKTLTTWFCDSGAKFFDGPQPPMEALLDPNEMIKTIAGMPSAQPEIIRCKDCRFAILTYDGDCKYCQYLEGEFGLTDAVYFDGNDYCSHAERRTNE